MYRLEATYWWYRALRDRVDMALDSFCPRFATLLDAGSGTGGLLDHLRARHPGARLAGIDLSADALALSRRRGLEPLACGSVNALPFRSDRFDVVVSNDVLYFAGIDDDRAVADFARVLAPGGVLLLNLPAFELLRGSHDEFVKGRRRYTRRDILAIVQRAALEPLRATYWNALLFPAIAMVRSLRRRREQVAESDLRPLAPRWNALLYRLTRAEAVWLRHGSLPFGTSVFCVARKP